MSQVKSFFEKVAQENHGKLDILVNNAFAAVDVRILILDCQKLSRITRKVRILDQIGRFPSKIVRFRVVSPKKHLISSKFSSKMACFGSIFF